ncbi:hypothetical protein [Brevundimonas sp. PAMC22021]|uniref:hypothetical protein n=1 Tax=Brevundimonas sp. PAMC22021 TaxID=2861285 RepID=UPI001C62506E|nr:hypothetical protein [Brevundimonas sp. PAMC22021]QYF87893.1 hypothetical protein KY493_05245 [Brevundimonas sp. PAMC22021]
MSAPDLNSEQGRADYRRELRRTGWKFRWGGLALIVLGAIWVLLARDAGSPLAGQTIVGAYALLAAGWVCYLVAVFQRTRLHKRRMAEGL